MADVRFTFTRSQRLSGKEAFEAVFDRKVRNSRGPLMMYSLPNELGICRWGLSVSRKVGNAPRRNRIKRMLREAIRLSQPGFGGTVGKGGAYDLVIVVRPHAPLKLSEYMELLAGLMKRVSEAWEGKR